MENKMKLIKEYNIPDDGNCNSCKSRLGSMCNAFGEHIFVHKYKPGKGVMGMTFVGTELSQCQACKDWLKQQKESKE
jgi:hypothetical protein